MTGKTLLLFIGGFVAGFYICKRRTSSKVAEDIKSASDSAVDEATMIFDNLLAKAESMGMSIADFRKQLNQP